MADIKFPFGAADVQAISGTGAQAVTIKDNLTFLNCASMTGAITLNLTFGDQLNIGSRVIIKATQDATGRNVVLGTGFATSAADLTGVANDVDIIEVYYDGTEMVNLSGWNKIVDAA